MTKMEYAPLLEIMPESARLLREAVATNIVTTK